MKKAIFLSVFLILGMVGSAQVPFHRGVNLTGWFQARDARHIQFERFSKKDFQDIKSLGCDVIRLPINMHSMTEGAPEYILDVHFLNCLDSAVNWAEQLNLHLILDNHSFHPIKVTDPGIGKILNKVWPQLAERYRDRSDLIIYEILNEPHGISNQLWGEIQQGAIDAIRKVDDRHTIIIGPSGYIGYKDLDSMSYYQHQLNIPYFINVIADHPSGSFRILNEIKLNLIMNVQGKIKFGLFPAKNCETICLYQGGNFHANRVLPKRDA